MTPPASGPPATFADLVAALDSAATFGVYGSGKTKRTVRLRVRIPLEDIDHARSLAEATGIPVHPRPPRNGAPAALVLEVRGQRAIALVEATREHVAPATVARIDDAFALLEEVRASRRKAE